MSEMRATVRVVKGQFLPPSSLSVPYPSPPHLSLRTLVVPVIWIEFSYLNALRA